jgi:beta-glucanase (GH16 family)
MKIAHFLFFFVFLTICNLQAQDRQDLTGYTLVFSDEFDERSIGDHRNKGNLKWGDYPPYGAASAFSFSHWMGSFQSRTDFATIDSGVLSLWTRYVELNDPNGRNWISGVIASMDVNRHGFAQRFGYWSARMKMPNAGQGAWSAFWLSSTSGIPNAGSKGYEVDIVEAYGGQFKQAAGGDQYSWVLHPWNADGSQAPFPYEGGEWANIPGGDAINEWHIYGCEVNPTNVIFYIDGKEVGRKPTHLDYVKDPLYIIINYAMQNDHSGEPFVSKVDSALQVDWVRAYSLPSNIPIPEVPAVEVENPAFEEDTPGSQESKGWGEWSPVNANPNGFVKAGGRAGNCYRMEGSNFSLFLSQVLSVREPGLYTFRAWARSSTPNGSLLIQQYQGGDQRSEDIPVSNEWTLVELTDINLQGSSIRIGLWFSATTNAWIEWDDIEFFKQDAIQPPRLLKAVSQKIHNKQIFDIPVSTGLTIAPVECRGGTNQKLVLTFNKDVVSAQVNVIPQKGKKAELDGVPVFSGKTVTIKLKSVSDVQLLQVKLTNVKDRDGTITPECLVKMKVLIGDTDGNGVVNLSDYNIPINSPNFQWDINCSGNINQTDTLSITNHLGNKVSIN